ncbi:MAG: cyclic nucleotide-binding domain-containing protein [Magnetococcales bacterium]|nr:cyclic nucleotide-binding domain-containing protein [Magnetococcales bacterium]
MLLLKLIDKMAFFQPFTSQERDLLVEGESYFVTYPPKTTFIREGAADDAMYILLKGRVAVMKNADPDRPLATLEPGAIIGELSFLTGKPRGTNVVTAEEATLFRLDGDSMAALDFRMQIKVKDQLIRVLVDRLEQTNQTLLRQKEMNRTLAEALSKLQPHL